MKGFTFGRINLLKDPILKEGIVPKGFLAKEFLAKDLCQKVGFLLTARKSIPLETRLEASFVL